MPSDPDQIPHTWNEFVEFFAGREQGEPCARREWDKSVVAAGPVDTAPVTMIPVLAAPPVAPARTKHPSHAQLVEEWQYIQQQAKKQAYKDWAVKLYDATKKRKTEYQEPARSPWTRIIVTKKVWISENAECVLKMSIRRTATTRCAWS